MPIGCVELHSVVLATALECSMHFSRDEWVEMCSRDLRLLTVTVRHAIRVHDVWVRPRRLEPVWEGEKLELDLSRATRRKGGRARARRKAASASRQAVEAAMEKAKGGEECDDSGRWAIEELLDVRRGGARGTRLFCLVRWAGEWEDEGCANDSAWEAKVSWTAFSELTNDMKPLARAMAAAAFAPSARTQHAGVAKRRRAPTVSKWRPTPRLAAVEAARAEERLKSEGIARSRKRKRALRLALVERDEWVEHELEHVHGKSRRIALSQDDGSIL
jgi:hypothetical protein